MVKGAVTTWHMTNHMTRHMTNHMTRHVTRHVTRPRVARPRGGNRVAVTVWRWPCGGDRVAVTVWRWPCGGHMTCHVTWQDNPLRVTDDVLRTKAKSNDLWAYINPIINGKKLFEKPTKPKVSDFVRFFWEKYLKPHFGNVSWEGKL